MTKQYSTPRLYVGTYAKYNNGDISGDWLDLEDYSDKESFLEACAELHKDEADPEFMFQDFEGFPKALYSESSVDDKLFEFVALDEDDREIVGIYWEHVNSDASVDEAKENYAGCYKNEEDWAYEFLDETGALKDMPDNLRSYFDYEAYARDARLGGDVVFVEVSYDECHVFWNR